MRDPLDRKAVVANRRVNYANEPRSIGGMPVSRPPLLLLALILATHSFAADPLSITRDENWLVIRGSEIPGGELRVNYLEAYCRAGSTDADWVKHTVVPHRSEIVTADRRVVRLRDTLADGVVVEHTITAEPDEVNFRLVAHNPTGQRSEAHWAQACPRLAAFVGVPANSTNLESYLPKCFIFLDGKLTRMPTPEWARSARYTPGQVWGAPGVPRNDLNPRPLSQLSPSNGLIGCFSGDETRIFATAWEPYQELFQGVAHCLHSDFRLGGLLPGERKEIRGKIYLVANDVPALIQRYEKDFPTHRQSSVDIFARSNLMAWCIVPFDAKRRGPQERAQMLKKLGIGKLAYDYRAEHIPTFDAEVEALKSNGIELAAWWFPSTLNDEARLIFDVIKRHKVHPQLWITGGGAPTKDAADQEARVAAEAQRLRPIAEAAAAAGCKVALYNHGGWFGEPENQIAIIERLARDGISGVGIVYNQHHGHDDLDRFADLMTRMKPHLFALNLNGMVRGGDKSGKKILRLGTGDEDARLLQIIRDSGWNGPVGIIDHRPETDSEETLLENLDGLDKLRSSLRPVAQPKK
jgi:sugar phosphate isomerase/epimerase